MEHKVRAGGACRRSRTTATRPCLGPLATPHPRRTTSRSSLGPPARPHPRTTATRACLGPLATPHPRSTAARSSLGPLATPHPRTTATRSGLGPLAMPHPRITTAWLSLGPLATPHPRRVATGLGSQRRMGQSRVARPQRRRSGARVRGLQLRSCRADTGDAPVALSLHSASSSGAAPGDATPAVFLDVQLDDPRRGNLSEEPAQWETARLHANLAGVVRSASLHQEPKEFAGLLDQ